MKPGSNLEDDLNLSSLDRVELMSAIEDRYQVDLRDREFSQVNTVSDLEKLIKKSSAKSEPLDYPYSPWAQRWPITWIRIFIYYLLVWPYTMLMARPKVIGCERIKNVRGPVLVISNHITEIDIGFILPALTPRLRHHLATAMRGELLRAMRHPPKEWFFLRRWYAQLRYFLVTALFNVFPLPQRAAYQESFRFAGQLADKGYSVLIFPEGKRTETGEMNEFRKGIGLLATRLNLPVIPMRIDGLFPLKVQKKHFAKPGTIQVRIGGPVKFESTDDPEDIAKRLQETVQRL
jgi:long-chain acyl-CoA synthetase